MDLTFTSFPILAIEILTYKSDAMVLEVSFGGCIFLFVFIESLEVKYVAVS